MAVRTEEVDVGADLEHSEESHRNCQEDEGCRRYLLMESESQREGLERRAMFQKLLSMPPTSPAQ